jgi:hypothetical protein
MMSDFYLFWIQHNARPVWREEMLDCYGPKILRPARDAPGQEKAAESRATQNVLSGTSSLKTMLFEV